MTVKAEIARLESEDYIVAYRAAQIGPDGKLYPPMSGRVDGEWRTPIELGKWERAEERPDLIKMRNGRPVFVLDKGNGSSVTAAYNPYIHSSLSPLNDQFSSAYRRPGLVTLEVHIPKSELTSGYRAEHAKNAVGVTDWHAGAVSGKLSKGKKRQVILSRWAKPVRIVPDGEVARKIKELLQGENVTIPANGVTPSLRRELEKLGVPVTETNRPQDDKQKESAEEDDGNADYSLARKLESVEDYLSIPAHPRPRRTRFDTLQELYNIYKREYLGRTIRAFSGHTITFKPGHFFRLIAGTPKDGIRKGLISKARNAAEAIQMIEQGRVDFDDISGYEVPRGHNIELFKDLLQDPDFWYMEGDSIVFGKRYKGMHKADGFLAATIKTDDLGNIGPLSFHPRRFSKSLLKGRNLSWNIAENSASAKSANGGTAETRSAGFGVNVGGQTQKTSPDSQKPQKNENHAAYSLSDQQSGEPRGDGREDPRRVRRRAGQRLHSGVGGGVGSESGGLDPASGRRGSGRGHGAERHGAQRPSRGQSGAPPFDEQQCVHVAGSGEAGEAGVETCFCRHGVGARLECVSATDSAASNTCGSFSEKFPARTARSRDENRLYSRRN